MVVMISYVIITEVELDDIINIIEGVRYGLTPRRSSPCLYSSNIEEVIPVAVAKMKLVSVIGHMTSLDRWCKPVETAAFFSRTMP